MRNVITPCFSKSHVRYCATIVAHALENRAIRDHCR